MRPLPILIVLAALAAGCVAPAATDNVAPESANATVTIDKDRPDTNFTDIALKGAAPDASATLNEAPHWKKGEWWKIHFESPLTGASVDFVRVVGDVQGDTYVVGMPHEGWYKEAVVYHTPCFGDVDARTLGCTPHNIPFAAVEFPLKEGATWTTQFERAPDLKTEVKITSPTEATIKFVDPKGNVAIEEVYDATIHEVRSFKQSTAVYTVTDHGYDFQGWITVPRASELVFEHGRVVAPVIDVKTTGPAAGPLETVTINGGYNRLSFILAAGNILGTPAGGVYRETATAPNGTSYQLTSIPGGPVEIRFYEARDPDGDWKLEHIAAGPGIAFIEGIAYHQYDIRLPDGAIRADHSHQVIR
jgi:hypothetical protein